MSHINFNGLSGRVISASYDLPDAEVVIVNKTSGQALGSPCTAVAAASNGTLSIPLPAGFPSGAFYLKAQDKSGGFIAQSVEFYVGGSGDAEGGQSL